MATMIRPRAAAYARAPGVARLYEDEWAELEDGARITGFLAILTTRNVREMRRRRSVGKRPPAPQPIDR